MDVDVAGEDWSKLSIDGSKAVTGASTPRHPSFPRPITPVPHSPPLNDIRILLFGDEYTWGFSPDNFDPFDQSTMHYPQTVMKELEKRGVCPSMMVSGYTALRVRDFAAGLKGNRESRGRSR
jgi:hypothetical protein